MDYNNRLCTVAEVPGYFRAAESAGTDMEKWKTMTTGFEGIKRGLLEAIDHAEGKTTQTRVYRPRPVDVKAIRKKIGLTQEQFSARFGISLPTLRHWERGDRSPHGPALVLLNVIERQPEAVMAALA